jgi:hypothetical protein
MPGAPSFGGTGLNSAGQWNGDMSALPPGFNPYASLPQFNAPQGQPTQDQALGLLVQAYNDSGGQITPYIQNFGAQYGITPDIVAQTSDAYHKNYSSGMDVTDFIKDVGGLVGITYGALALAGGVGGAASGAAGNVGAAGGSGAGSAAGGAGTVLTPLNGTAPIFGAPIDAAGAAIGPATAFGTSSIPYDAAVAGGLGSVGSIGSAAGSGAGAASNAANSPVSAGPDPDMMPGGALAGAGNVASSIPDWLKAIQPYAGLIGAGLGLVDSALQPDSTTQTNNATNNSTSTSSLQLPSQITGPASDALTRAGQLLGQGQQFAPMPYGINKAAGDLATLGQNNAPTTSSFASGANINPYLDMTFNAAADATQNRLASEYANAGQGNSPQLGQARSQQLQQLAAGIYGPGYQNAQNLQYGAQEAGVSRGLAQQDANLNRTIQAAGPALQIGQYMQGQQQQQLNSPTSSLNSYISQLGGLSPYFPGTSTQSQTGAQTGNYTQPIYNNPLLSALGGAQLGSYFANLGQQPQQQGNSYTGMQSPQNMQIQPYTTNPYAYM